MPVDTRRLPRWPLAGAALLHAGVLGFGAIVIPFRPWTSLSVVLGLFSSAHLVLALGAALGAGWTGKWWRGVAWGSLGGLVVLTWLVLDAAVYLQSLYGSLGEGVGVALAVALTPAALLTLPIALWGLAATGGVLAGRRAAAVLALVSVVTLVVSMQARERPRAQPSPSPTVDSIAEHLPEWSALEPPPFGWTLYSSTPVRCGLDPASEAGAKVSTVVVAFFGTLGPRTAPHLRCLQAASSEIGAIVGRLVRNASYRAPVKIDVVTGVAPLRSSALPIDMLALRPGLDGVCAAGSCLMPWQLVGANHFVRYQPLPFIPDLRLGVSANALGASLGRSELTGVEGLARIETESFVVTSDGELVRLTRLRPSPPTLDAESISGALDAAEAYVLAAQDDAGVFRYVLDPYTGGEYVQDFVLPRQAGTTLGLCDARSPDSRHTAAAVRSAREMGRWERIVPAPDDPSADPSARRDKGAMGALVKPADSPRAHLGDTALPLIALLACRDLVGPALEPHERDSYDLELLRLGRWLLRMQRPNGSFYPSFDLVAGVPEDGPDPLYAAGQAVYALSLLEKLLMVEPGLSESASEPVSVAVERAMSYFGTRYWDRYLLRFFYLEENWHCLAAEASLEHHRHDDYERFCLDYMEFKKRHILDENSRVADAFVGGHGFGNLLPPHNTPTAGLGETLSASMAIKSARGEPIDEDRILLLKIFRYLLRQQWTEAACFACDPRKLALGAFSESIASPVVRIDYVQHVIAAFTHGLKFMERSADSTAD